MSLRLILAIVSAVVNFALGWLQEGVTFEPWILFPIACAAIGFVGVWLQVPFVAVIVIGVLGLVSDHSLHQSLGVCTFDLAAALLIGTLIRYGLDMHAKQQAG